MSAVIDAYLTGGDCVICGDGYEEHKRVFTLQDSDNFFHMQICPTCLREAIDEHDLEASDGS